VLDPPGAGDMGLTTAPLLVCTACRHAFAPAAEQWADLTVTGCPRCGGWTWLASTDAHDLIPTPRPAEENPDV
jgi:Zn-finger nucleic acid-binding protein